MKINETKPYTNILNNKTEFYALGISKLDPYSKLNVNSNAALAVNQIFQLG